MTGWLGPSLILGFCLSQAFRDVYFGRVFQDIDFFAIILVAFLLSTVIFGAISVIRARAELGRLRHHLRDVAAMNVTTAIAWTCYFFALTHLEPSIVNTVHSAVAPFVVLGLGALGVRLAKHQSIGPTEGAGYAGIALSILGLWWVVLSNRAGIPTTDLPAAVAALALLLVSGTSITVSLLYSKRLHDHGFSANSVTAVRYLLIIAIAAGVEFQRGLPRGIGSDSDLVTLAGAATLLIVLPLYSLQAGVARTGTLTAQVLRTLGPVFVFVLEQFDQRMSYSRPVLICILAYSVCGIVANVAHGRQNITRRAAAVAAAAES